MKIKFLPDFIKSIFLLFFVFFTPFIKAQETKPELTKPKSAFWEKVQFGGGFGLNLGTGFTNISLSPSAIYNFNKYVSAGVGSQYSHLKQRSVFTSNMYGVSGMVFINPLNELQLSVEIEQLRVNVNHNSPSISDRSFWNTGLFLGAGYRINGTAVGLRYNVLFDENENVYGDALMPFVRFYF